MTEGHDRIESMQIDVDEIRRNRAAIAEMEKGLNSATEIINSYASAIDELVGALNGLLATFENPAGLDPKIVNDQQAFDHFIGIVESMVLGAVKNARAAVTKYNHIVDANKMVPTTEEKE